MLFMKQKKMKQTVPKQQLEPLKGYLGKTTGQISETSSIETNANTEPSKPVELVRINQQLTNLTNEYKAVR